MGFASRYLHVACRMKTTLLRVVSLPGVLGVAVLCSTSVLVSCADAAAGEPTAAQSLAAIASFSDPSCAGLRGAQWVDMSARCIPAVAFAPGTPSNLNSPYVLVADPVGTLWQPTSPLDGTAWSTLATPGSGIESVIDVFFTDANCTENPAVIPISGDVPLPTVPRMSVVFWTDVTSAGPPLVVANYRVIPDNGGVPAPYQPQSVLTQGLTCQPVGFAAPAIPLAQFPIVTKPAKLFASPIHLVFIH